MSVLTLYHAHLVLTENTLNDLKSCGLCCEHFVKGRDEIEIIAFTCEFKIFFYTPPFPLLLVLYNRGTRLVGALTWRMKVSKGALK